MPPCVVPDLPQKRGIWREMTWLIPSHRPSCKKGVGLTWLRSLCYSLKQLMTHGLLWAVVGNLCCEAAVQQCLRDMKSWKLMSPRLKVTRCSSLTGRWTEMPDEPACDRAGRSKKTFGRTNGSSSSFTWPTWWSKTFLKPRVTTMSGRNFTCQVGNVSMRRKKLFMGTPQGWPSAFVFVLRRMGSACAKSNTF